jgi:hypothetical protein
VRPTAGILVRRPPPDQRRSGGRVFKSSELSAKRTEGDGGRSNEMGSRPSRTDARFPEGLRFPRGCVSRGAAFPEGLRFPRGCASGGDARREGAVASPERVSGFRKPKSLGGADAQFASIGGSTTLFSPKHRDRTDGIERTAGCARHSPLGCAASHGPAPNAPFSGALPRSTEPRPPRGGHRSTNLIPPSP